MDWPVCRAWIALDPLPEVVEAACRADAQLLVCHHPLLFNPIKCLDFATPVGAIVEMAAKSGLAIFAAHTNLDKAAQGINTALARRLGLSEVRSLIAPAPSSEDGSAGVHGLGRLGRLSRSCSLRDLALQIKGNLGLPLAQMAGRPDLDVAMVAICSGSGGGVLQDFLRSPAQVLVSGDLRYHDARTVEAVDRGLIDIGHFGSEQIAIGLLKTRLDQEFAQMGIGVEVVACPLEKEPFVVL
jgi:dinuclear metal center YbgI/SA1388 family protein